MDHRCARASDDTRLYTMSRDENDDDDDESESDDGVDDGVTLCYAGRLSRTTADDDDDDDDGDGDGDGARGVRTLGVRLETKIP